MKRILLSLLQRGNVVFQGTHIARHFCSAGTKEMDTGSGAPEPPYQVTFGEEEYTDRPMLIPNQMRRKGGKKIKPVNMDEEQKDEDEPTPDDLYMDSYRDPADYKISILTESEKAEIFKLHTEDPLKWTVRAIAQKYNMNPQRSKAVIYLMRLREAAIEQLRPSQQAEEEKWDLLYQKHVSDPEKNTAEFLSNESGLTLDHMKDILRRMEEHLSRLANVESLKTYQEGILASLQRVGVDSAFKETVGKKSTLESRYHPELFGDEDFDFKKEELRQMIIKDSKAFPKPEFPSFIKSREEREALAAMISAMPTPFIREGFMYKSKIAYRDISGDGRHTVIRTRSGKLRLATALEEVNRSWNKPPNSLDMRFHQELVEKFADPDGDNEAFKAYMMKKKADRKALIGSHQAKTAAK